MRKTVFVDYDGTLHDSESKYIAALDGLFSLNGNELWGLYLKVHLDIVHGLYPEKHDDGLFNMKLLFDQLRRPYDEPVAREILQRLSDAERGCWESPQFFSDAFTFLDAARSKGHRLCLTTAARAPEKIRAMEALGLRDYFDCAFDRDILGPKTEPAYFENALRLSNSAPGSTLSVGDSLAHDIVPATQLGIITIWVNRTGKESPAGESAPDFEVKDLLDALDCL